jgi:methionine-rich copper-binding protein CopC
MRRSILCLGPICMTNLFGAAAAAHAFLDHAIPPLGGTESVPPKEIRLFFSEPIEPLFSRIVVALAAGQSIKTGPAAVFIEDHSQWWCRCPGTRPADTRSRGTSYQSIVTRPKAVSPLRLSNEPPHRASSWLRR